jgi:uncharacterized protein
MTIRITNLRIPLNKDKDDLGPPVAERLRLGVPDVFDMRIARKATDARRKPNISFVYTVDVDVKAESKVLAKFTHDKDVTLKVSQPDVILQIGSIPLKHPPVVVGMGPAGLFAALWLAKYGFRPIVLERGRDVDSRARDVALFWQGGELDPDSNVQFGEGGAGTFSDGKLTTRVNDPRTNEVLQELIAAGAPPEIAYLHKPHIGTDQLRLVVKNIREKIIALGGKIHFLSKVTDIYMERQRVTGIEINGATRIPCDRLILGIGHSARDTYRLLYDRGVELEAKPISMGVRIEHPQKLIDVSQYGQTAGHPRLGAADYALVHHDKDTQRAVYSFCMCPGGKVVAAASELGGVVVNGMSNYARNSGIANSALVVAVNPDDYGTTNPLGGIDFQRAWEQAAFRVGGSNYHAPAQRLDDFFAQRTSADLKAGVASSYRPAVTPSDLHQCLPDFVTKTLANGLKDFGKKIRGFGGDDVIMTGVETRTSAPIRICRNDRFESVNTGGLYPIGEGAGYAGGITSAALDGLNAAIQIIQTFTKPRE